jgi:Zn ribbon nucleic-acid-binding protein
MHTRRRFIAGAVAPLLLAKPALAATRCIPDVKRGGELCKGYVDIRDAFQETYHASRDPGALWIACVAAVFAVYGHVVQQPRIARKLMATIVRSRWTAGSRCSSRSSASGRTMIASRFALQ